MSCSKTRCSWKSFIHCIVLCEDTSLGCTLGMKFLLFEKYVIHIVLPAVVLSTTCMHKKIRNNTVSNDNIICDDDDIIITL